MADDDPLVGRFGHSGVLEHMARHWLEDAKLLLGIWPEEDVAETEGLTDKDRKLLRAVVNTIARAAVSMLDDEEEA